MSLSITQRDPAAGAIDISPTTHARFTVSPAPFSAPVNLSTLNVRLNGARVITSGQVRGLAAFAADGVGGVVVDVAAREPLVGEESATVAVSVADTDGAVLTTQWQFTIADAVAPKLADASPQPFTAVATSPTTLTMRFTDAGAGYAPDPTTLDVFVDHVAVIAGGDDAGAGYSPVVAMSGHDLTVTLTPPAPWTAGHRIAIAASVADDRPGDLNIAEINWYFDMVDTAGPRVTPVSPLPATRGLSVSGTTLIADVLAGPGATVDTSTIAARVDGAPAITGGTFQSGFTGSINAVTGGVRVSIDKSSAYAAGRIVHVDLQASDTVGRAGERRVWSVQFSPSIGILQPTTGVGDVVRVVAFDLSHAPFGDPARLRHTGFGWDGRWYDHGDRDDDHRASWWVELGDFPISGYVAFTDTGGWRIFRGTEVGAWCACAPAATGWSMAGSAADIAYDGAFAHGIVTIATDSGVFDASFVDDLGYRTDATGRRRGAHDISGRTLDQTGFLPASGLALAAGPYLHCARTATALLVATAGRVSVVGPSAVAFMAVPGDATRLLAGDDGRIAWSYVSAGAGAVEVWKLADFATSAGTPLLFLDDGSVPPLDAEAVTDIDIVGSTLIIAQPSMLHIVDIESLTMQSLSQSALGLTGAGVIAACAGEQGLQPTVGHVYVGANDPGRVVRLRLQTPSAPGRLTQLSDGVPATSVAAVGTIRTTGASYIRTAMTIAP